MSTRRVFAAGPAAVEITRVQYQPDLLELAKKRGCVSLSGTHEQHLEPFRREPIRMAVVGEWSRALAWTLADFMTQADFWFFHDTSTVVNDISWPPRTSFTAVHAYSPAAIADFLHRDPQGPTVVLDRSQNMSTFEMWWPHVQPEGLYLAEGLWNTFSREHWDEFGIDKVTLHRDMMVFRKPSL